MTNKPKCPNAPSPCFCTGECEGKPPRVEILQYGGWETEHRFPVSDEDLARHVEPGTAQWMEQFLRQRVEAAAYEMIDEALSTGQGAATINNDEAIEVHKLAERINQMAGDADSLRRNTMLQPTDDPDEARRAVERYRENYPLSFFAPMQVRKRSDFDDLFNQHFGDPDDDHNRT